MSLAPRPLRIPGLSRPSLTIIAIYLTIGVPLKAFTSDSIAYAALNKCGIAVVLPKEQKGFSLVSFEFQICKKTGRCSSEVSCPGAERGDGTAVSFYKAQYVGPNQCKIHVEGEVGGSLGDNGPTRTWTTTTSLFGKITLRDWPDGTIGTEMLPVKDRSSLWNRQYRDRFPMVQYFTEFTCPTRQFSPSLALEILRSMHIVPAE